MRQGGGSANRGNGASECKPRPQIGAVSESSATERLDYIAAMVQELKMMSAQADYRTLTSLLDMAYHEAVQRKRARRSGQG